VICDERDSTTGIRVVGKNAKILRGEILDCTTAVHLVAGGSGHLVEDVVARQSFVDGFDVDADRSKLRRVASIQADDDGFDVGGERNKIEDAEAAGSGGDGFDVDGQASRFQDAFAVDNHRGWDIVSSRNSLKSVTAINQTEEGLRALEGTGNRISRGVFMANGDDGVELGWGGNRIDKTVSSWNGSVSFDAGFHLRNSPPLAKGNQLKGSRAAENRRGVRLEGGGTGSRRTP
jgi:hypothetical protein